MTDQHARRTSHDDQNTVVRFIKNWLSIWKGFFDTVFPYAVLFAVGALGVVALSLYALIPTFGYGVYLFGIDGMLSNEEFTGNQGIVLLVLEVLWVSLNATTALAAYRTFKGDSSD